MPDPLPPIFLATAVEAVDPRRRDPDGALRRAPCASTRKGAIDLVTEIDLRRRARVPRAHRASAFPITSCSARSSPARSDRDAVPEYCWVFDPVDGTTNYAHGLPIFCSSLALEIGGVPVGRARSTIRAGASCSPPSAATARG